jgi:pantoate--beta-alanine ligase
VKIAHNLLDINEFIEYKKNYSIGFVPTMGALHAGHLSLIKAAKNTCDVVIASIFVNPLQFNNPKDLATYPQHIEEDTALLTEAGCDLLFLPSYETIYPANFKAIDLDLGLLDMTLEGAYRKGHFNGVVQVVYRLFEITKPQHAFFGLKDFQQCLVIKKLTDTFFPNISLHFLPTIRESSGMAMSSRNEKLSPQGKELASNISKTLDYYSKQSAYLSPNQLSEACSVALKKLSIKVEYVAIVDALTLAEIKVWESGKNFIILTAVYIEEIRLIDNMFITSA